MANERIDAPGAVSDEMENMYLNFSVGDQTYGIEIRYILQIIGMQEITEMPDMEPYMKGFINMRGSVIPVISMQQRLGKMESDYTDRTCIVVVQVGKKDIGLIVDAIQETLIIEPEKIAPPPSASWNVDESYITGVANLSNDRTAILLDVRKLFGNAGF